MCSSFPFGKGFWLSTTVLNRAKPLGEDKQNLYFYSTSCKLDAYIVCIWINAMHAWKIPTTLQRKAEIKYGSWG